MIRLSYWSRRSHKQISREKYCSLGVDYAVHTKNQIVVALLIIVSTCLFFAHVTEVKSTTEAQIGSPALSHDIISLGRVTGPMTEVNETTTTERPPPELNPVTVGLIGGFDIGIVFALIFFIVKRK